MADARGIDGVDPSILQRLASPVDILIQGQANAAARAVGQDTPVVPSGGPGERVSKDTHNAI